MLKSNGAVSLCSIGQPKDPKHILICKHSFGQTFGKAMYHIGLVDANIFSPSFARFSARFGIFLGAELILSLVTFGIPFLISFSMMAFSRRHQGFPDYMLGLTEIDASKNRIYLDKVDIELTHNPPHKDPPDFNLIHKE